MKPNSMQLNSPGLSTPLRFAMIGNGAIAKTLLTQLQQAPIDQHLKPICIGTSSRSNNCLNALLEQRPEIVIEAAGHQALRDFGAIVLAAGIDLLVASVGALADVALETQLRQSASESGASILIPAGALGGLDALRSARWAGIESVSYTSQKAPKAWLGTAAETMIDLASVDSKQVFFTGSAREAALTFPQNANVAAAVALAGIGFDRTQVQLCADPQANFNRHLILAHGAFGKIDVSIEGRVLPSNPKTSMLAPMSLVDALLNRGSTLRVL